MVTPIEPIILLVVAVVVALLAPVLLYFRRLYSVSVRAPD